MEKNKFHQQREEKIALKKIWISQQKKEKILMKYVSKQY